MQKTITQNLLLGAAFAAMGNLLKGIANPTPTRTRSRRTDSTKAHAYPRAFRQYNKRYGNGVLASQLTKITVQR